MSADVRTQPLRIRLVARRDVVEVERLGLVDALEPQVLLRERDLDLLAQNLRVEQVLHADADARGLIRVRRADAASRRADLQLAEPPLGRLVDRDVPRHDQVRVPGEAEPAAVAVEVELRDEDLRVDDAAGSENGRFAGEDSRRKLSDLVRVAAEDDRVPGVRAALVTADDVRLLGEQVDDLALALVAPLRPDDHGRRHGDEV